MNEAIRLLEEKIAFLEHHVTEQDKVMLGFAEDIARLQREIAMLNLRLANGGGGEAGGAEELPDERPPHY